MSVINYDPCSEPLGTHELNDCGEELLAGGSGIILFDASTTLTDPSNGTQILAEIAAGRATKIDNVKIGIDKASPVTIDSNIVGGTTQLVTYNRSGTIIDANVSNANVSFYNSVFNGRKFAKAIIYLKGTEESAQTLCYFIEKQLTFTGDLPIKNNNDDTLKFDGNFTWRSLTMPELPDAPISIFITG